jgi:RHH-type transcriptional regulator, proline utilization regulon repressor / proline dehydrogenase / delta 1-pyrroline-5-carboxylate dehydrogenase
VFTRKAHTDISYLACARMLLESRDRIYPQFATHNAHTAAAVLHLAGGEHGGFEFQRLHGMGEALHEALRQETGIRCRIYAPVGAHRDLLAYLVRRLLENGANSSFVHQIIDESVSPETIAQDPRDLGGDPPVVNPRIVRPPAIFGPARRNARGWDLTDPSDLAKIDAARARFARPYQWSAGTGSGAPLPVFNPADPGDTVGRVFEATSSEINESLDLALAAAAGWAAMPVAERAGILRRVADLYEFHAPEFFALAAREAGKTLADGIAEVREAVDFLRYYAGAAEAVERESAARGVIVCISPWNFPLAIFTGQIAAALAAGNVVIAKPAEQTPLIASRAVALMHEAGIPGNVLRLLHGDGPSVGGPLTADPRIGGVCFTGSTGVAKRIDRQLAKTAPGAMLIAETGGLNAMIVDSTALPEQAVGDILASAFQSAGQRCSALRVLYLQREVEERVLEMLFGAMDLLTIGDPWDLASDIGPLIDAEAHGSIETYCREMERAGRLLKRSRAPTAGLFCAPAVVRVSGIEEIEREVFGPILHVARFDAENINDVVGAVNAKGYGLTFGIHTRIDRRVQDVVDAAKVGNLYVNRNQIGAVVGSQPFGGEGLSGTGPKAGGPHYLARFRRTSAEFPPRSGPSDISVDRAQAAISELKDTADWATRKDRVSALRDALRGRAGPAMSAAAALDIGPLDLPGPTGESNRLSLKPKGTVLCLGPDAEAALDQAVQALRCGNRVLAIAPGALEILSVLLGDSFPILALDGVLDPNAVAALDLSAVAHVGGDPGLRRAMARRDGPVIPLIDERIAPQAYANERAICIDTTAAGGNTALLALAH